MKFERFVGLLAVGALILAIASVAVNAAEKLTVGEFVTMVADAKGLPAETAQEASGSLAAAGYTLPNLKMDAVLTEGDVVGITNSVGVTLTSTTPDQEFDRDQASAYFAAFGSDFGPGGDGGGEEATGHPNPGTNKGKGKKVGHFKSPSEPE